MTWRDRFFSHPLTDAFAVTALSFVLAGSAWIYFVQAQDGSFTFPIPCQEAGITDPEACKALLETFLVPMPAPAPTSPESFPSLQLPEACLLKGIMDPMACRTYMESLMASPPPEAVPEPSTILPAPEIVAPQPVLEAPPQDFTRLPQACLEAGITDPEGCKRLMLPPDAGQDVQTGPVPFSAEGFPEPCRLKGLTDPEACRTFMMSLFTPMSDQAAEGERLGEGARQDILQSFDPSSFLPAPCREKNVLDPKACAELMSVSFAPPSAGFEEGRGFEMKKYLSRECEEQGITTAEACWDSYVRRAMPKACLDNGAETEEECRAMIVARNLPTECSSAGIYDEQGCKTLMSAAFLPKTCKDAGATDERACEKAVFDKYGRPDGCAGVDDAACRRLIESGQVESDIDERIGTEELPDRCRELGAKDLRECERLGQERLVPLECREAGVFSREGCEKFMFEKYRPDTSALIGQMLPEQCRDAGIEDPQACRKHMEASFFPKECVAAGLTEPEDCMTYMEEKLPAECKALGLKSREECEAHFRKKHLDPICAAQGIDDGAACGDFIYAQVAQAVHCVGLDAAECALAAKGRHLGGIMEARTAADGIKQRIDAALDGNRTFRVGPARTPRAPLPPVQDALPFEPREERGLTVLPSVAEVAVTADDDIEASAPLLLAYDADADGIPDEIEERQGLDPDVLNVPEEIEGQLAPVEEAILGGEPLGQPVLEGELDGGYVVEEAVNAEENIVLSGEAPAGEVVTLYLYSTLPVVVTIKTDADGRWSYDFSDALKDGEHRAYIALNDATGKVVKKSGPLSFFISEARAASPEEFVGKPESRPDVNVEAMSEERSPVRWYVLGGAVVMLLASICAWLLMRPKKGL